MAPVDRIFLVDNLKCCAKCQTAKPKSDFYPRSKPRQHHLRAWCKDCENNRSSKYLESLRENNPAKVAKYRRNYYVRNKNKVAATNRRYNRENPEKVKAQWGAYYRANKEKYKNRARLRQLKIRQIAIEDFDREEIYVRDGGKCHICRRPVPQDYWHLDHLVPLSRGGEHSKKNVAVAHSQCNLVRYNTGPAQLRIWGDV